MSVMWTMLQKVGDEFIVKASSNQFCNFQGRDWARSSKKNRCSFVLKGHLRWRPSGTATREETTGPSGLETSQWRAGERGQWGEHLGSAGYGCGWRNQSEYKAFVWFLKSVFTGWSEFRHVGADRLLAKSSWRWLSGLKAPRGRIASTAWRAFCWPPLSPPHSLFVYVSSSSTLSVSVGARWMQRKKGGLINYWG